MGWSEMKCCQSVFSLLQEQTEFSIMSSPGFIFKDDGMYITAVDAVGKILQVKLFKRDLVINRIFHANLLRAQYFYVNHICTEVMKLANEGNWSTNKVKTTLHHRLTDFFAVNFKQFK